MKTTWSISNSNSSLLLLFWIRLKGGGGSLITFLDDLLITFIKWSRPSCQMIDCCASSYQTLTDCFALAKGYLCLRAFRLFMKARWPTVLSYVFCQPLNVCKCLLQCTFRSFLLHIHSGMKLAHYNLLISLGRQMCQETIINWHQCFCFWENLGSPLCSWKELHRHKVLAGPSHSDTSDTFWSLRKEMKFTKPSHVSCRVNLQFS